MHDSFCDLNSSHLASSIGHFVESALRSTTLNERAENASFCFLLWSIGGGERGREGGERGREGGGEERDWLHSRSLYRLMGAGKAEVTGG